MDVGYKIGVVPTEPAELSALPFQFHNFETTKTEVYQSPNALKSPRLRSYSCSHPSWLSISVEKTQKFTDAQLMALKRNMLEKRALDATTKAVHQTKEALQQASTRLLELASKLCEVSGEALDQVKQDIAAVTKTIATLQRELKEPNTSLPPAPPSGVTPQLPVEQRASNEAEKVEKFEKELADRLEQYKARTATTLQFQRDSALIELRETKSTIKSLERSREHLQEKMQQNKKAAEIAQHLDAVKDNSVITKDIKQAQQKMEKLSQTEAGREEKHDNLHSSILKTQIRADHLQQRIDEAEIREDYLTKMKDLSEKTSAWNRDLKHWLANEKSAEGQSFETFSKTYEKLKQEWVDLASGAEDKISKLEVKIDGPSREPTLDFVNRNHKEIEVIKKEWSERTQAMLASRKSLHDELVQAFSGVQSNLLLMNQHMVRENVERAQIAQLRQLWHDRTTLSGAEQLMTKLTTALPKLDAAKRDELSKQHTKLGEQQKALSDAHMETLLSLHANLKKEQEALKTTHEQSMKALELAKAQTKVEIGKLEEAEKSPLIKFKVYDSGVEQGITGTNKQATESVQTDRIKLIKELQDHLESCSLIVELDPNIILKAIEERFVTLETRVKELAPLSDLRDKLADMEGKLNALKAEMRKPANASVSYISTWEDYRLAYESYRPYGQNVTARIQSQIASLRGLMANPETVYTEWAKGKALSPDLDRNCRTTINKTVTEKNAECNALVSELQKALEIVTAKDPTIALDLSRLGRGVHNNNNIPTNSGAQLGSWFKVVLPASWSQYEVTSILTPMSEADIKTKQSQLVAFIESTRPKAATTPSAASPITSVEGSKVAPSATADLVTKDAPSASTTSDSVASSIVAANATTTGDSVAASPSAVVGPTAGTPTSSTSDAGVLAIIVTEPGASTASAVGEKSNEVAAASKEKVGESVSSTTTVKETVLVTVETNTTSVAVSPSGDTKSTTEQTVDTVKVDVTVNSNEATVADAIKQATDAATTQAVSQITAAI